MGRRAKLTTEQAIAAQKEIDGGKSVKDVAVSLGVTNQTLYKYLKSLQPKQEETK